MRERIADNVITFQNPSWNYPSYSLSIMLLFGIFSVYLVYFSFAIYFWKFDPILFVAPLVTILVLPFAIMGWPYVPCTIELFPDSIIFNKKSNNRFFNPKVKLLFRDIIGYDYLTDEGEIIISTKKGVKRIINVTGADQKDITKIMRLLKEKGIEDNKIPASVD